jgi:DNA repair photolyase
MKTGTREWAGSTVNCVKGCAHDCLYCYARHNAVDRFKQMKADEWPKMRVDFRQVGKRRMKRDGLVMFPSSHDITPEVLTHCMVVLQKLIDSGNQVLLVSKPHLEVIEAICEQPWHKQLVFRFSIGMLDDYLRKLWEPGAPSVEERIECLHFAHASGYGTSVSAEPLLEPENALQLYEACKPYLSDDEEGPAGEFWIGKLNRIRDRVRIKSSDQRASLERIIKWQTDKNVMHIVETFRHANAPHVRWKDSYKTVIARAR